MPHTTRRDAALLLGALAATHASAQKAPTPSKMLRYEDLAVKTNGQNRSRDMLNARTHGGFPLDMHETELAAGAMPRPPHSHEHEEMVLVREGVLDVTIAGKSSTLGPGSAAWVASGEHHGWRNVSSGRARYFVLAFGRERP